MMTLTMAGLATMARTLKPRSVCVYRQSTRHFVVYRRVGTYHHSRSVLRIKNSNKWMLKRKIAQTVRICFWPRTRRTLTNVTICQKCEYVSFSLFSQLKFRLGSGLFYHVQWTYINSVGFLIIAGNFNK